MKLSGANILMGLAHGAFDGHAHVFDQALPMAPARRYTPSRAASFETYCALLRAHGLDGALLVQPSFLGTDNGYLIASLARARGFAALRFRGVAVTSPATSHAELARLHAAGVVGMRLNLLGTEAPDLAAADWRAHLRDIADLGWHLEVQVEGERLPRLLPRLVERSRCLVIDHFGLPTGGDWRRCPGFAALLAAPPERVMVKLSAPYRAFPAHNGSALPALASPAASALIAHFGTAGLVWGSDWPWTQHEAGRSYEEALAWRALWEARADELRAADG